MIPARRPGHLLLGVMGVLSIVAGVAAVVGGVVQITVGQ